LSLVAVSAHYTQEKRVRQIAFFEFILQDEAGNSPDEEIMEKSCLMIWIAGCSGTGRRMRASARRNWPSARA
jgi:hypothetical protein